MRTTVTLDKKDIARAIDALLKERGLKSVGDITINHFAGDMREQPETTVTVQVETIGGAS